MMSSLYIGASGLKTHGEGLGVISHNIANVNTIGYKQQSMQFDDIFYATGPFGGGWESQVGSKVALSQVGMGARPGAVRTLFAVEGAIEPGVSIFDMAILGKGFFQVTNPDTNMQYYTRAGNFHLDNTGVLRDPNGYFVTGIPIAAGSSAPVAGPLTGGGPIVIDPSRTCPAKATTVISSSMNLGLTSDKAQDIDNPYFALLQSWNAWANPPLSPSQYGYAQPITVYDAEGDKQELMLYMDLAPAGPGSSKVIEYVLARPPADPATAKPGEGLLMAGTMTFASDVQLFDSNGDPIVDYKGQPVYTKEGQLVDINGDPIVDKNGQPVSIKGSQLVDSSGNPIASGQLFDINGDPIVSVQPVYSNGGQLIDMSAFTFQPDSGSTDLMDLKNWKPSQLDANGLPFFSLVVQKTSLDANGLPQVRSLTQEISLDLGIQASGGWQHPSTTAADVGSNQSALPSMGQAVKRKPDATTAYGNTSSVNGLRQDGYAQGWLMDIDITAKGVVVGIYSNGKNLELYQIPVCRFTSEDGLWHEGNNLYSASPDKTGPMTMGVPDTENYGSIMANHIEGSNVELSREITMMIIIQRGFQMNSKSITTSDTMLQRAIELKRS